MSSLRETWKYASTAGRTALASAGLAAAGTLLFLLLSGRFLVAGVCCALLLLLELAARALVGALSSRGAALVKDETPKITPALLDRFYNDGFDPELGWIRKPKTAKLDLGKYPYVIDARGSRRNPGHEHLPLLVGIYGDSYTFCREVDDRNTWQWHLSEILGCNVLNFGVGNYGFDQALLRLKREFPANPTPITITGMVPQGIARNLSVWKHYNEFGNVLAFKPRFEVEGGALRLIRNFIDRREKFFRLEEYLGEIQRHDYFYERRFKREAFRPPYAASCIVRARNLLLAGCKGLRRPFRRIPPFAQALDTLIFGRLDSGGVLQLEVLFRDAYAVGLLLKLVDAFSAYAKSVGSFPVFVILPMKDDLWFLRNRRHFYREFVEAVRDRMLAIDLAPALLEAGSETDLYRTWHYSPAGNRLVARTIAEALALHAPGILAGLRGHGQAVSR